MDDDTSIRCGQLFDRALVGAYGKAPDERKAKVAEARALALELCKTKRDRSIIECRSLEAFLESAIMNRQPGEAKAIREDIEKSPLFGELRRRKILRIADRFLNEH